jgi:hypothetical protein
MDKNVEKLINVIDPNKVYCYIKQNYITIEECCSIKNFTCILCKNTIFYKKMLKLTYH